MLPEIELGSEPEPDKLNLNDVPFDPNGAGLPSTEDDEEETKVEVDSAFLKFEKRISRCPDQVLRYSKEDKILWVSDSNRDPDIPNCEHCGSRRTFEFQIMPQLLNELGIDHRNKNALDWGTLVIYTCSKHCEAADGKYVPEYLFRQQFDSAGLGDSIRNKKTI